LLPLVYENENGSCDPDLAAFQGSLSFVVWQLHSPSSVPYRIWCVYVLLFWQERTIQATEPLNS